MSDGWMHCVLRVRLRSAARRIQARVGRLGSRCVQAGRWYYRATTFVAVLEPVVVTWLKKGRKFAFPESGEMTALWPI